MEGWKDGRVEGWKSGRMEGVSLSESQITRISRIARKKGFCLQYFLSMLELQIKESRNQRDERLELSEPQITRITWIINVLSVRFSFNVESSAWESRKESTG